MILPGRSVISTIIRNVRSPELQAQPCGVDLTLKRIHRWTGPGVVDLDNTLRLKASGEEIPFTSSADLQTNSHARLHHNIKNNSTIMQALTNTTQASTQASVESALLEQGAYLVEFNETVDMPLTVMGQIFVRSSLFRSGALLNAGLMDSGYKGAIGGLLQILNPHGLLLFRHAKLAQMAFHEMKEPVEGYNGVYQSSGSV